MFSARRHVVDRATQVPWKIRSALPCLGETGKEAGVKTGCYPPLPGSLQSSPCQRRGALAGETALVDADASATANLRVYVPAGRVAA